MPISPDEVRTERLYPTTPQGVMELIDDRLRAHAWRWGDDYRIEVPGYLVRGTDSSCWHEIVAAYRAKGWLARGALSGPAENDLTSATLYFAKMR